MSFVGILRMSRKAPTWAAWLLAGLVALAPLAWSAAPAAAQAAAQTAQTSEPTAADRQAAGQAYDRATASYLARDYARAATLFETAYRLAPASAALLQAVRAHERAGNGLRAATLALRLQALYASDEQAARQAEQTLAVTSGQFLRVDVACTSTCTVELDGVLQEQTGQEASGAQRTSFFANPDEDHAVRATFETGPVERSVRGTAGRSERLSFDAPAAVVAEGGGEREVDADGGPEAGGGGGGLSPIVFVVGLVATAAAGGVLIWSGVDTLDGVGPYEAMPTAAGLADGQYRELRTNILIGVTGALALTTLVLALVTDWGGGASPDDETTPTVSFSVSPEGGHLALGGRF